MKNQSHIALLSSLCAILGASQLMAAQINWSNNSTDFNSTTSWTGGVLPGTTDAAAFNSPTTLQPNLTANITVGQLAFATSSSSGTILTGNAGTAITVLSTANPAGIFDGTGAAITTGSNFGNFTINANVVLGASGASAVQNIAAFNTGSTLTINGSITATNTLSNIRSNTGGGGTIIYNGAISGNIGFDHLGANATAGTALINSTSNTYTGFTRTSVGVLEIKKLSNFNVASSIGAVASNLASNLRLGTSGGTAGILRYTGTGDSTDRLFRVDWTGSAIESSGSGAVNFTNTGAVTSFNNVASTLVLGGNNTGNNTMAGLFSGNLTAGVNSITKNGTGKWILTNNNTHLGATTVNAGTLVINGNQSTATGTVTVASGATLGGNGTIGGATFVDGTLAPGNSPGLLTFSNNLTLNSTATTSMEIGTDVSRGATYDAIDVGGTLTYGGTLSLNLTTTFGVGSYSWNLFDFGSQTNSFAFVTLTGSYSGNLTDAGGGNWNLISGSDSWTFSQSDGVLGLTVVPEPSTWALLAGSLTILMTLRRRKQSW